MKKIIATLFLLSFFILWNIQNVLWYWEFYPAPIKIQFIDSEDWSNLSNYELELRTWKSLNSRYNFYTNWDWVLDVSVDTPLWLDRTKWEYALSIRIWMSRFTIYNEKLVWWMKIYYNKEDWYIKKVEWIENKSDYSIVNQEKWLKTSIFPWWSWFWVTWAIWILVFFTTYNLIMSNDQKFLRLRNSTFEQEEIRD